MKIGSPPEKPTSTPAIAGRAASGESAKAAATPGAAESSAQVALSSTAANLISGVAQASPEFDTEKVARISNAIAEGKFSVNAEAIADKLIANAQELLGKTSR